MTKQTTWYIGGTILFLVLLFGGQALYSSVPQADAVSDATLSIDETSWDIGDVSMADGVNTKSIALANNGSESVTITRMETSCMCTTVQIVHADGSKSGVKGMVGHGITPSLSETIEPGETAMLLVNFDPNAHGPDATGPITRTVTMETNSTSQPEITLHFSGNVTK